jgi:isopentenyl-diphosphate delta-isomerase
MHPRGGHAGDWINRKASEHMFFTLRQQRKWDHITLACEMDPGPLETGFSDIHLIHQALPSVNISDISLTATLFGKTLRMPLLINAMTGGSSETTDINASLARVAAEAGIGMAVGSQMAAIQDPLQKDSYAVVRKQMPQGLVLANVSANASPEQARIAVEMLEADALQLHLNPLQELLMAEGDRNFDRWKENISRIQSYITVPLVVKEVGHGLSKETVRILYGLGLRFFDTGGAGGTNFGHIELRRHPQDHLNHFKWWGIPTAISLLEVRSVGEDVSVVASGGVYTAEDAAKALALGAKAVGIAGPILKTLMTEGGSGVLKWVEAWAADLQMIMALTGARDSSQWGRMPLVITGKAKEWRDIRHI